LNRDVTWSEKVRCSSNKAKISSRVGGVSEEVYFGELVFESDEQEFGLRGVKSKRLACSHPRRDRLIMLKSVLKVRNA